MGSWGSVDDLNVVRISHAAAVVGGTLYAVGGANASDMVNTVEAYDPATNSWITRQNMGSIRHLPGAVAIGGSLYVVGGSTPGFLNSMEVYDPATNTWTAKASMTVARQALMAGYVNGILYVAGGSSGGSGLTDVEAYNPQSNAWSSKAALPFGIYSAGAAVSGGKLYVIGGYHGATSTSVFEYDPAGNTWTARAPMPTARYDFAAIVLPSGRILACGGTLQNNDRTTTVEEYDPATNTWAVRPALTTTRGNTAGGYLNGRVYVIGGDNTGGARLASVDSATVCMESGGSQGGSGGGASSTIVTDALIGEKLKSRLRPGEIIVAPNVMDPANPASQVIFGLKGDPGETVSVDIYDEAGKFIGTVTVVLDPSGFGSGKIVGAEVNGRKLGTGVYWAVAKGGGVNARIRFAVVRKKK
jgi:N-acetylneuraminic acid mutarotase